MDDPNPSAVALVANPAPPQRTVPSVPELDFPSEKAQRAIEKLNLKLSTLERLHALAEIGAYGEKIGEIERARGMITLCCDGLVSMLDKSQELVDQAESIEDKNRVLNTMVSIHKTIIDAVAESVKVGAIKSKKSNVQIVTKTFSPGQIISTSGPVQMNIQQPKESNP